MTEPKKKLTQDYKEYSIQGPYDQIIENIYETFKTLTEIVLPSERVFLEGPTKNDESNEQKYNLTFIITSDNPERQKINEIYVDILGNNINKYDISFSSTNISQNTFNNKYPDFSLEFHSLIFNYDYKTSIMQNLERFIKTMYDETEWFTTQDIYEGINSYLNENNKLKSTTVSTDIGRMARQNKNILEKKGEITTRKYKLKKAEE